MISARRRLILCVIAGGPFLDLRLSMAVETKDPKITAALTANRRKTKKLLLEVTELGDKIDDATAKRLLAKEVELYRELLVELQPFYYYSLSQYVLPRYSAFVRSAAQFDVPIWYSTKEFPRQEVFRPVKRPEVHCREEIPSVVADMIIEAVGLKDVGELLHEVIDKTPELKDEVNKLSHALGLRDWDQATRLVTLILEWIARNAQVRVLAKILGKKAAAKLVKSVLTAFSVRLVPFVGEAYTGISAAIAIYSNANRLLDAVKCAAR